MYILTLLFIPSCSVKPETETVSKSLLYPESSFEETHFFYAATTYGNITVIYPQINSQNEDPNNLFIQETINNMLHLYSGSDDSDISAQLTSEITYYNGRLLCFVVEGLWNDPLAAHPLNFWEPLLIDLQNQTLLSIGDIIDIDNSFLSILKQSYQEQVVSGLEEQLQTDLSAEEMELKGLIECYANDLIKQSLNATILQEEPLFKGGLTNNSFVISVPLPHSFGDHYEVYLDYELFMSETKLY